MPAPEKSFEITTQPIGFGDKHEKIKPYLMAFDGVIKDYVEGRALVECLKINGLSKVYFYSLISTYPFLESIYLRAQMARSESFADEIVDIADTEVDSNRARNRIDARKWFASKIMPSKYGDRLELHVQGQLDLAAAMAEARSRTLPNSDPRQVIDAEVQDITTQSSNDATDNESVAPSIFD